MQGFKLLPVYCYIYDPLIRHISVQKPFTCSHNQLDEYMRTSGLLGRRACRTMVAVEPARRPSHAKDCCTSSKALTSAHCEPGRVLHSLWQGLRRARRADCCSACCNGLLGHLVYAMSMGGQSHALPLLAQAHGLQPLPPREQHSPAPTPRLSSCCRSVT